MFAMAGLGLCNLVDEDIFQVNAITSHMSAVPSAIHGMLHLSVNHAVDLRPLISRAARRSQSLLPHS